MFVMFVFFKNLFLKFHEVRCAGRRMPVEIQSSLVHSSSEVVYIGRFRL